METISRILDTVFGLLKLIGAAALTCLMLLTVADVIGRYFKHPIFGSVEITGFLALITVAAALPFTYKTDGHIGVEILVRLFSKKTQLVIDLCTRFLSLVLFILITWQMVLYAGSIHASGEVSMNLNFPTYYIIYLLAAGLVLFCITILESFFSTLRQLRELNI